MNEDSLDDVGLSDPPLDVPTDQDHVDESESAVIPAVSSADGSSAPSAPATTSAPTTPAAQSNLQPDEAGDRWARVVPPSRPSRRPITLRLLRIFIWLLVICLVVISSLFASAWFSGFRDDNGWPDVMGMIRWVLDYYNQ